MDKDLNISVGRHQGTQRTISVTSTMTSDDAS